MVIERNPQKLGFTLLGGGVTGVFFHFGVLAALDDHLSRKSTDFDVHVGTSAGSLVATTTAGGLHPQSVVESILKDDHRLVDIQRKDIYRFSFLGWTGEFLKLLWTLFYVCYLKLEKADNAPSFFWGLKDALPSGLFSMRYYEAWVRRMLESNNMPAFFSQIPKELLIPATELDSGKRVIFGGAGYRHIPIFKAIPASSAIPMFFQPVEIEGRHFVDGGFGETAHLDLAANAGASLIIVVNPMVPIRNDLERVNIKTVFGERGKIKDKGLTYIYDQTMRNELRFRTHTGIKYMGYMHPDVDFLLIEPDEDDATMFLVNPMDFESRKQIVEYAYNLTRRKLTENTELWRRTLDKHSVTLVGV